MYHFLVPYKADKGKADLAVRSNKRIAFFYGKTGIYVIIFRSKDKNTTQGNFTERVGSLVVLLGD